jgi:hypothetical protein
MGIALAFAALFALLQGTSRAGDGDQGLFRDRSLLFATMSGTGGASEGGVEERPLELKKNAGVLLLQARAEIEGGIYGIGERKKALHEIDDAIEELVESIDPDLWRRVGPFVDPKRLDPCRGGHVFHEERDCASEIFEAIDEGEIKAEGPREELLEAVDLLVQADRLLAERAILDAEFLDADAHDIERARDELEEGDELVEKAADTTSLSHKKSLLSKAIDHEYRHAWDRAIDAIDDL